MTSISHYNWRPSSLRDRTPQEMGLRIKDWWYCACSTKGFPMLRPRQMMNCPDCGKKQ